MKKGGCKGRAHCRIFSVRRLYDVLSLMEGTCNPLVNYLIFLQLPIQNFLIRVLLLSAQIILQNEIIFHQEL